MITREGICIGTAAFAAAMTLVAVLPASAADPLKLARRCRTGIVRGATLMVEEGLAATAACSGASGSGGAVGCSLTSAAPPIAFARASARAGAISGFECTDGNPVLANYQSGGDVVDDVLQPAIGEVISGAADTLLGPLDSGVTATRRPRGCRAAIARAMQRLVLGTFTDAARCQKRLDRGASSFGPIAAACVDDASAKPGRVLASVGRKCRGLTGAQLGSCEPLPDCVATTSQATGRELARLVYGGEAVCGNATRELGEECDDGNLVDTDSCSASCQRAVCGDGVVEDGVEACDDGNLDDRDFCKGDCTPAICGDGVVNGTEDCDDANTDPADGCDQCVNKVICDGDVIVTVAVSYSSNVFGASMELRYPATYSVPGGGLETDDTRFTDLTERNATFALNDQDKSGDGVEETLRVVMAVIGVNPPTPGDWAEVRFDCEPGSAILEGDIQCNILSAAGPGGTPSSEQVTCEVTSVR